MFARLWWWLYLEEGIIWKFEWEIFGKVWFLELNFLFSLLIYTCYVICYLRTHELILNLKPQQNKSGLNF